MGVKATRRRDVSTERAAYNRIVSHERRMTAIAFGAAVAAPIAVAAALIPVQSQIGRANVALVLVVAAVAVAAIGRRFAVVLAALSAAAWFDFFHTAPHYSFTITAHDDVVTAAVLLVVGLIVGELAVRSRRHREAAVDGSTDIAR